jgi:hypothetical protein
MARPSINDWPIVSEQERVQRVAALNPYAGEGSDLLEVGVDLFWKNFGHLKGLQISGPGVYHGVYGSSVRCTHSYLTIVSCRRPIWE